MTAMSQGVMPGDRIEQAAEVLLGETGDCCAVPILPERGLLSSPTAHTLAIARQLHVERGARTWQVTSRPQQLTRALYAGLATDLDAVQAVYGPQTRIKTQVLGPWSLAARVELRNGHRMLSEAHAAQDLADILVQGCVEHVADLRTRFSAASVIVAIHEPLLAAVLAGRVPGTSDFDTIPAVPEAVVAHQLAEVCAALKAIPGVTVALGTGGLAGAGIAALVHPDSLICDLEAAKTTADLDALGAWIAEGEGANVMLVASDEDPRTQAVAMAARYRELGIAPTLLAEADVIDRPGAATLMDAARRLRCAAELSAMCERDAGDL